MPTRHDYRIGWICALPLELAAAQAMLDRTHPQLPNAAADRNNYILGSIGAHNVVITCLPAGVYGTTSATATAIQMRFSYESIQWCLLVGIGGGVGISGAKLDIRLGDVVVSEPTVHYGGVIQYDYGKAVHGGEFVRTGTLDKPPEVLLKALARLQAQHMVHGSTAHLIHQQVLKRYPLLQEEFSCPDPIEDRLFVSDYYHRDASDPNCYKCDPAMLQSRYHQTDNKTRVFYGLIASANQVIKDSKLRDELAQRYGILCFEMEAAGVMNVFPSLVIRGVCDYSDSHKNKRWQGYAAMAAASYAKELILFMPLFDVANSGQVDIVSVQESLEATIWENAKQQTVASFYGTSPAPMDTPESDPIKKFKSKVWESPSEYHNTFSNPERPEDIHAISLSHFSSQFGSSDSYHYKTASDTYDSLKGVSNTFSRVGPSSERILEKISPEIDPREVLNIRSSMARKERLWHPWPCDCIQLVGCLDLWFRNASPPLVVAPASGARTRVKDLAVEIIRFLIQWKEIYGSNYKVLWALGLSDPDRPKNALLKSLIFSISKAYPEEFHRTLSRTEIISDIEDKDEELWLLLHLLMSSITNAFVIVDPEDYHFLSRILNLANECYNTSATSNKVRFFIVFNDVTNEIRYPRTIQVPPPPPRARMQNSTLEPYGWKLFTPGF
uniref:5'-methylthioadenosine/S-adenosylhomocysteine nucleosidase n=1 Tax=Talaromyces marneffei PM1 TaxID=1077442 RepID=A0A093VJV3_TALMA